jgi:hypothetical protein
MSTASLAWNTNNQSITSHLGGLANNSQKTLASIDLSGLTLLDLMFQVTKIKTNASGTSSTGYVNIYVAGTCDGGTTYGEGASSDAAITLTSPPNLILVQKINCVANATTYKGNPVAIAALFNGPLPDHVIFVVENKTGAALDSTDGNHAAIYQTVKGSIA